MPPPRPQRLRLAPLLLAPASAIVPACGGEAPRPPAAVEVRLDGPVAGPASGGGLPPSTATPVPGVRGADPASGGPCAWFPDARTSALPVGDPPAVVDAPACEEVRSAALQAPGEDLLLCVAAGQLRWLRPREDGRFDVLAEAPAPGAPNAFLRTDRDGDGREEAILGWGMGRGAFQAKASVEAWAAAPGGGLCSGRLLGDLAGDRQQVASISLSRAPSPELHVTAFEGKYDTVTYARRLGAAEGWDARWRSRMGTTAFMADLDGDERPDRVLGRVYGDAVGDDGDLSVWMDGGEARVAVPTLRGVRAAVAADTDGDGRDELWFGDGWHQDYGKVARYRLNRWRWDGAGKVPPPERIDERPGMYAVLRIEAVDLDGDLELEVLAAGNKEIVRYDLGKRGKPAARKVADCGTEGAFAVLRSRGGPARLVVARGVGRPVEVTPLEAPGAAAGKDPRGRSR
ncbi:hypothetical protein L6R50_05020 [Myxococcota bacterium]|nr:hypothetical protein [Myxococcota bacterium]